MVSDHGALSGFKQFTNRGELDPGPILGAHSRSHGFTIGRTGSAMITNTTSAASQEIVSKVQLWNTIIHGGARKLAMSFLDLLPVNKQLVASGIGSSTYHALVYSGHTHTILGRTKSFRD
jgi:hypothetical protein